MGLIVWVGVMIVIFVVLTFLKGFETGTLEEMQSEKVTTLNQIDGLGVVHDDYYTLAYKTTVLDIIRTQQYRPSIIGAYVDSKIDPKATINMYSFTAAGELILQIDAPSYLVAVRIWNALLEDKSVILQLNLNSFSEGDDGTVSFQLKGILNLKELYARNAKQ
jgi:hypothetical protein